VLDLFYFRDMEHEMHDFIPPRSIKQWSAADRPREKFASQGRDSLTDVELVALLLGTGYKNVSAVDLARQILRKYQNDLNLLAKADFQELMHIKGIGAAKALHLSAALELGRRRKSKEQPLTKYVSSRGIYFAFQHLFEDLAHEEFRIILLGPSNRFLVEKRISIGSATHTIADPKKILRELILHQANAVILMHNHPSGNLVPSAADRKLTQKIAQACEYMDFRVVDHIIFGQDDYYSFVEHGEQSLTAA
jgi:DNA repair protein RadC